MDFFEPVAVVRSRWREIIAITVVGVLATWAFGWGQPEPADETATHTLVLRPTAAEASPVPDAASRENLGSVAELVRSPEVVARVARHLEFTGETEDLGRTVRAVARPASGTIEVIVTFRPGGRDLGGLVLRGMQSGDERPHAALATAFARQLMAHLEERQRAVLRQEAATMRARLDALQASLRQPDARAAAAAAADDVRRSQREALLRTYGEVFERSVQLEAQPLPTAGLVTLEPPRPAAQSAQSPLSSNRHLVAAGGVFGFLAAFGALLIDARHPRVRSAVGAERAFRLPVLAEIPVLEVEEREAVIPPESPAADAFRELRTALRISMAAAVPNGHGGTEPAGPRGLILVTSALGGEGTTSTVVNLAAAVAETGQSVLVVDCDLDQPRLHEYLGVADGPGLHAAFGGKRKAPELSDLVVETPVRGVRLVRAGVPESNGAARSLKLPGLVARARELASVVILDAPPLTASYDAFDLASHADAVLVVCRDGDTDLAAAGRVAGKLARLRPLVSGVVLVCAPVVWRSGSFWDGGGPIEHMRALAEAWTERDGATAVHDDSRTPARTTTAPPMLRDAVRLAGQWMPTVIVTILLWLVVRGFAIESFAIPTPSMTPALEPGDRILVNRLAGRFADVERGDVVVFIHPPSLAADSNELVKRVVAVAGDTIEAEDGRVVLNGQALEEPYLAEGVTTGDLVRQQVPEGHVWVMGDNRSDSADSRVFGPVRRSAIVGRAFAQVWPPLSFETL